VTWEIRLPVQDRSDPIHLGEIDDAARDAGFSDEERQVTLKLVMAANLRGASTVGDVIDQVEAAGPAGGVSPAARRGASGGRAQDEHVDRRRQSLRGRPNLASPASGRDHRGRIPALCANPACMNFEVDPATGAMAMTKARRWWCPAHREGREDDMAPYHRAETRLRPLRRDRRPRRAGGRGRPRSGASGPPRGRACAPAGRACGGGGGAGRSRAGRA
jgi:hypothetical protein